MLSSFLFAAVDVERYRDEVDTYKGNVDVTREGLKCRAWNKKGDYTYLGNQSYCRNPGPRDNPHAGVPWCFTADDKHTNWGYCNIKKCQSQRTTNHPQYAGMQVCRQ